MTIHQRVQRFMFVFVYAPIAGLALATAYVFWS